MSVPRIHVCATKFNSFTQQGLSDQLQTLETEKANEQKSLTEKLSTLGTNLAGLVQERDEVSNISRDMNE